MRVRVDKGRNADGLVKYFRDKGYRIRLSKCKRPRDIRWVKFKCNQEKMFFILRYGKNGAEFIENFEIETGLTCGAESEWW